MHRGGTGLRNWLFRAVSFFLLTFSFQGGADYVETAPRPGAPLPPAIGPGECPLHFLPADIQQAKQAACSSGAAAVAYSQNTSTSCCGQIRAIAFKARVKYANETGRLLLPQASADACVQTLNAALAAAGIPFLETCGVSSCALSEDLGKACGASLTTVYDFWSATNRTFPGTVGAACYGSSADCGLCTTLVTNKILSIGASTGALLNTSTCQDLAQIAMTAAAYPVSIANGIAQCLHDVDIAPIVKATKCTAINWKAQNLTAVSLSCGPQQVRADRCCNLILGVFSQGHMLYENRTGHSIDEAQTEVCFTEFAEALVSNGIPPSVLTRCPVTTVTPLGSVGCYNYTTLNQRVPARYLDQLEQACNGSGDCGQCKAAFFSVGSELANTSSVDYFNMCQLMVGAQYFSSSNSIEDLTNRLNCYYQFPPMLQLGLPSPRSSKGPKVGLIVGLGAAVAVVLVTILVAACLIWRYYPLHTEGSLKALQRLSSLRVMAREKRLVIYSRKQLEKATKNFDESRLLGSGGSGRVFVGDLNGEVVAIKEARVETSKSGMKEAWNEVATLAQYRHRNLVLLKGCCHSGNRCSLVYEFLEQGSLEDHLYPPDPKRSVTSSVHYCFLNWPTREKIALGVANGLAHLHNECKPRCIHRDVKPSNILLTHDFEPKLSDFGLAKSTGPDETHMTTAVAGTWGFLSPEYIATGQLTEKSDVYSFGVVLLALVAGRRPTLQDVPPDEVYLPEWGWALGEMDELERLVDPRLEKEKAEHGKSMERMARIGLLCVHTVASIRPTMCKCVAMLMSRSEIPPLPHRPMTLYTIASIASSDSGSATMYQALHSSEGSEGSNSPVEKDLEGTGV